MMTMGVHICVINHAAAVQRRRALLLMSLLCLSATAAAHATDIHVNTQKSALLDERMIVRVEIVNPSQASTPVPEPTTDFEIGLATGVAQPAQSSKVVMEQGRTVVNEKTYTYTFIARPKRTGLLTLPSFVLHENGQQIRSAPQRIKVKTSIDVSGDVFCRVEAPRPRAYIGEPLNLRLEIFIKQYTQQGLGAINMKNTIDFTASRFGVFKDLNINSTDERNATLRNEKGVLTNYAIFSWDFIVYPNDLGPYDFGEIVVVCKYPTWVTRDIFFGYTSPDPRIIRVKAQVPELTVVPPPAEGQPASFNGAVGRFVFRASAEPTSVAVGDPITLTMHVSGNVPMNRISAPKLEAVPELTDHFELSGEALASDLQADAKIFTQTIRALREDVNEIPALPFSFFNPDTERYETAWSQPIEIQVRPAERLAMQDASAQSPSAAPLVERTGGLRANHMDIDAMLADQTGGFGAAGWTLIAGMPMLYAATWLVTRRSTKLRNDAALRRRTGAASRASRLIRDAAGTRSASGIAGAVLGYISDRCNVPAAGMTRSDAVELLTQRGVGVDLLREAGDLLETLEYASYASSASFSPENAAERARRLVDALEKTSI